MDKVKEILAKESINESDLNYLMANISFLSQADLVRLGLAPAIEAVKESVVRDAEIVEEPKTEETVEETPKPRGRPSRSSKPL